MRFGRTWRNLSNPPDHAGFVVFATSDPTAAPEARMVALRWADRDAGTVSVNTDAATPKLAELRSDPRAALQYCWGAAKSANN